VFDALTQEFNVDKELVVNAMQLDHERSGLKGLPAFLKKPKPVLSLVKNGRKGSKRQQQHKP